MREGVATAAAMGVGTVAAAALGVGGTLFGAAVGLLTLGWIDSTLSSSMWPVTRAAA